MRHGFSCPNAKGVIHISLGRRPRKIGRRVSGRPTARLMTPVKLLQLTPRLQRLLDDTLPGLPRAGALGWYDRRRWRRRLDAAPGLSAPSKAQFRIASPHARCRAQILVGIGRLVPHITHAKDPGNRDEPSPPLLNPGHGLL
jgi:hypothetical protein